MSLSEKALLLKEDFEAVHEAGKQAEYDEFWGVITKNWTRKDYRNGFQHWDCQYIRPPKKIIPTSNQGINYLFSGNKSLLKVEKEYFDFSQKVNVSQTASYAGHSRTFDRCISLIEIEDLGMQPAYYDGTFYDCLKLEKIEIIRSQEDTLYNDMAFGYCTKLKDLTIEGTIGTNFNIKWSPLSVASLKSIIKHLKDYAGTDKEFTYTVTFKSSAFAELEKAEFDSDDSNWGISTFGIDLEFTEGVTWTNIISYLGWSLSLQS